MLRQIENLEENLVLVEQVAVERSDDVTTGIEERSQMITSESGALLRDFARSPEQSSSLSSGLLREFPPIDSTHMISAPSSSLIDSKRKPHPRNRRPASPTPHQATSSQSMGTKDLTYRPSGANLDISVCLYGPSRVFFGQFRPPNQSTTLTVQHESDQKTTMHGQPQLLPSERSDDSQVLANAGTINIIESAENDKNQVISDDDIINVTETIEFDNTQVTVDADFHVTNDDIIKAIESSENDNTRVTADAHNTNITEPAENQLAQELEELTNAAEALTLEQQNTVESSGPETLEEQSQKKEDETNETKNNDAISQDPRWTGADGFPRLARRYDYGLADIGSLTSKRRILISENKQSSSPSTTKEHDEVALQEKDQQLISSEETPSSNQHVVYSIEKPPRHVIDLQALRRISSQGISDVGSHRPVAWRVLLGYLPIETDQWEEKLRSDRQLYRNLVAELFVRPNPELDDAGRHKSRTKVLKGTVVNIVNEANRESFAEEADSNFSEKEVSPSTEESLSQLNTPLNDAASNKNNKHLRSKNGPIPIAYSPSANQEGFAALVPARIREQWKQDGRDGVIHPHVNAHIQRMSAKGNDMYTDGHTGTNTLLVVDDEGYTPDDINHSKPRISVNDDPLNTNDDSKWHQFFENAALLDEVRKDVVRTHPDLHFFLEPEENLGQRRYAALERILFVWAKLNRGVKYVQGMNEIVGTIYFVLANDFNEEWAAEAEADAYFLFNIIVTEMRDVFVPDLDMADTGIQGRISNMMQLLSLHDPEVRCHLQDIGIDPTFYSIRWLTTLLSREFTLPDTIRLWDSMFASTHKENFLRYVCVTMVMMIRDQLLDGDFSVCLRLLQSYPPTNVDRMLESSRALWIYESQVTLACHKSGIGLSQALSFLNPPPGVIMAYGLKRGRAEGAGKRVERGLLMAKDAAEETASSVANAGRKIFGNAAKTMSEWSKKRAEAKDAKRM